MSVASASSTLVENATSDIVDVIDDLNRLDPADVTASMILDKTNLINNLTQVATVGPSAVGKEQQIISESVRTVK